MGSNYGFIQNYGYIFLGNFMCLRDIEQGVKRFGGI